MKTIVLSATMLVLCITNAYLSRKAAYERSVTDLALIPATNSGKHMANISYIYNEPAKMPGGQVCKSKMQANFYLLYNIKVDAAVAWYCSHLSGFKKISGSESQRSQAAFYNSDGTTVVIVTGDSGAQSENTNAYSVADERYQPGISEKTINSLTRGKTICQ
jgi:hypothetical protein